MSKDQITRIYARHVPSVQKYATEIRRSVTFAANELVEFQLNSMRWRKDAEKRTAQMAVKQHFAKNIAKRKSK